METIPFEPYYDRDGITIYNADCRQVLPFLGRFDLLLTDPPYGIGIAKMNMGNQQDHKTADWDDNAISDWLIAASRETASKAIIWGGNYYRNEPSGSWLVWDKETAGVTSFADAELAWTNLGKAIRLYRHLWSGPYMKTKENRVHPTQKPLALMRWCVSLVPDAETIFDPFMGSGTTLVAAKLEGRKAVGIEINERYAESAAKRLEQGVLF